ncbi:hypothetical protein V3589_31510 [Sinorhizobium fredii]|uniref:hypothetical protein n=1 Tax=Rhizobium fredii TaxID=380 RepID=UPI003099FD02
MYDKETKRTRQKLVWTIDLYDPREPRPTPAELAAGTPEQREGWAAEITKYLDDRKERARQNTVRSGIAVVAGIMKKITEDLNSQTPTLSDDDRQRVTAMVRGWAEALHIAPQPARKPAERKAPTTATATTGEDPRAFGDELVEQARSLRSSGLSIAGVADKMTADGHKVSKSWVQKWTT